MKTPAIKGKPNNNFKAIADPMTSAISVAIIAISATNLLGI